jgi:hypothetical protein
MAADRRELAKHGEADTSLDFRLLNKVDGAFESVATKATEALRSTGPDADIGTRFEAALLAVLETAAAKPDLTQLCLVEAPGLGKRAVDRKEVGLQRFVDLLDGELAAANDGVAPPLVSEMVVGGIYEVMQRSARAGDVAGLPELASQLRQLWLPALRGQ